MRLPTRNLKKKNEYILYLLVGLIIDTVVCIGRIHGVWKTRKQEGTSVVYSLKF